MRAENLREIERRLTKVKVIYTDVDGTLVGPGGSLFAAPEGTLTLKPAGAVSLTVVGAPEAPGFWP